MKLLTRLLGYARKYWSYLIISMLAIFGMTLSQLYSPMVVRQLTGLISNNDPSLASEAFKMSMLLLLASLVYALCAFLRSYFTHYAAWHFVADLRVMVYDKLQTMSLKYFHDKQTGQLMSRVVNDTANIELLIAHAVPDLIVNFFILLGVAIMLFYINPILAALSLITIPMLIVTSRGYAKKILPMFRQSQRIMGELNGDLQDNISGIKEIQIFNQNEKEKNKIKYAADSHALATLRALRRSATYHSGVQFVSNLGTIIVIGYGGYMASKGLVPVQDIVAFLLYLGMFYAPISTLARVNEDIQTAIASAERILEVFDSDPDVKEMANPIELKNVKGEIKFNHVDFNYINGISVLKNINVDISPGKIIAVVGPTGVGKTTFIHLISRFYDPVAGDIYIDGVNIKEVSLKSLHDNMSIVLQDIFLFNGSVADNIAYGFPGATREQIITAAKIAHADEFIVNFSDGYDELIGERGVRLSGGQKQRLSIARAILRDKPILILDEATASIDVETEKLIHEAMDTVMENRTTIIIAHRLSTVKKADTIYVLDDTSIRESGTHEQLLEQGGLYAKLCEIQL